MAVYQLVIAHASAGFSLLIKRNTLCNSILFFFFFFSLPSSGSVQKMMKKYQSDMGKRKNKSKNDMYSDDKLTSTLR